MTTSNSGAQPQNRAPQSIGFLLLDNFTLISLASAVEPLRMANQLSGRELYRWTTLTVDGGQVWASDGLQITPDASMHKAPALDTVIVCGGIGIQRTVTREHVSWLQGQCPPIPSPRRGLYRQLGPGLRRPAGRLRLQRALGMPGGNAGSFPTGVDEHPFVHP